MFVELRELLCSGAIRRYQVRGTMLEKMNMRRKRLAPFGMWIVFEIVAVTLWLTKDNLFYLLNFSYIGTSITVGLLLFQFNYKHARRIRSTSGWFVYADLSGTYMPGKHAD